MTGEMIFWGALAVLFYVAHRRFNHGVERPRLMLNWDDDRDDVTNITSHYNRLNESHLRLVRGEYPPQTEGWQSEAFQLDHDPRGAA